MAKARHSAPSSAPNPGVDITTGLTGVAMGAGLWYFLAGLLHRIPLLEGSFLVAVVQWAGVVMAAVVGVFGIIEELRKARARRATEQVFQALDRTNVADFSPEALAASIEGSTGTKLKKGHLVRLVEQRKQQLLIDDEQFRTEVSALIVDYLQPLPRNAKRVLNRFRVNLLIADRRGLFTSEPKVTRQQIGKWLVLAERWPQLRMSLSAAPETMKLLEGQSGVSAPPRAGAGQAPPPDPFMDTIRTLAPTCVGDEDLRRFVYSAPPLAVVLPRLVHYGTA